MAVRALKPLDELNDDQVDRAGDQKRHGEIEAVHSRSRPAIGVAANQASKVVRVAGIAEGWRHVFVVTRRRCPFVAPTWSEVETRGRVGGEVLPP